MFCKLVYNIILVILVSSVIWHFYTSQWHRPSNSSNRPSLCKLKTILLTIFPFTFSNHSSLPLCSGNRPSGFCFYQYVMVLFCLFCFWFHIIWCLSNLSFSDLPHLAKYSLGRSILWKRQDFILFYCCIAFRCSC